MVIEPWETQLVVRYADIKKINCIEEHEKVIAARGYVWFGKFGVCPKKAVVEDMIKKGNGRIILKSKDEAYFSSVVEVRYFPPERGTYPDYYDQLMTDGRLFTVWYKLTELVKAPTMNALESLIVKSSRGKLLESAHKSMSSFFITTNKAKIEI